MSWFAIIIGVVVMTIFAVIYFSNSTAPTACSSPGQFDCPEADQWKYTLTKPKRTCSAALEWDTPGGVGPSKCAVDCGPKAFPCWDDTTSTGECRPGATAAMACAKGCSATDPCLNGGTCNGTSGACDCPGGYAGARCEVSPDANCATKGVGYCNAGKCSPITGKCFCAPGSYGDRCDTTGQCDLKLCQAVDKGATCADPTGPTPAACVCSGLAFPATGAAPCSQCPPGRGPPGDCTLYEHQGGTFLTHFDTGCYPRMKSQAQGDEDCQRDFGSSSLYYTDYCGNDSCSAGAVDRNYCRTDGKWYTSDPNLTDNYMAGGCPDGPSINPAGLRVF